MGHSVTGPDIHGRWEVRDDGGEILSTHDTMASAWRKADKLDGEPHNAKESRHDWSAEQYLKGE